MQETSKITKTRDLQNNLHHQAGHNFTCVKRTGNTCFVTGKQHKFRIFHGHGKIRRLFAGRKGKRDHVHNVFIPVFVHQKDTFACRGGHEHGDFISVFRSQSNGNARIDGTLVPTVNLSGSDRAGGVAPHQFTGGIRGKIPFTSGKIVGNFNTTPNTDDWNGTGGVAMAGVAAAVGHTTVANVGAWFGSVDLAVGVGAIFVRGAVLNVAFVTSKRLVVAFVQTVGDLTSLFTFLFGNTRGSVRQLFASGVGLVGEITRVILATVLAVTHVADPRRIGFAFGIDTGALGTFLPVGVHHRGIAPSTQTRGVVEAGGTFAVRVAVVNGSESAQRQRTC